jgi:hypothetical protein
MPDKKRDLWDKIGLCGGVIAGVLSALTLTAFGFITSNYLGKRELREANTRLYSELMSRREESESALRKDMFNSIIATFVSSGKGEIGVQVLNLELLVYNFHESINLKPLFNDLKRKIDTMSSSKDSVRKQDYLKRVVNLAREITRKQRFVLEAVGAKKDVEVNFTEAESSLQQDPTGGFQLAPFSLTLDSLTTEFTIRVLQVIRESDEINIEMRIHVSSKNIMYSDNTVSFNLSYYDFPVIDNTRLIAGQRCSLALNDFSKEGASLTMILFPGEYASLKEKPFMNEVMQNIFKLNQSGQAGG